MLRRDDAIIALLGDGLGCGEWKSSAVGWWAVTLILTHCTFFSYVGQ